MPRLPPARNPMLSPLPMGEALVSSSERLSFCWVALMRRTWASTSGRVSVDEGDSLKSMLMYLKLRSESSEL